MKKSLVITMVLFLLLAGVFTACSNTSTPSSPASEDPSSAPAASPESESVNITFLNTKNEIAQQIMDATAAFTEANPDVTIDVMSTDESPVEYALSLYAAGTPATLCMLDAGDILRFADKAVDLSDQDWVSENMQVTLVDGKTIAFPFAVEGYGLVYNKDVLNNVSGGTFDPSTINTTDALESLFENIQASGTAPIAIGSMDWSLGNHFLPLVYANQPDGDVAAFIDSMKAGTADLVNNAAFNGVLDTFDVMAKYNIGVDDPMAITYDVSTADVATGEAAMTFNGCWTITPLQQSNETGEFGFIPVPVSNNPADKGNNSLAVGATKQVFIDKAGNSDAQIAAAEKFLDWIVYDSAGQDFLVNKSGIIPAFKNITLEPASCLAKDLLSYSNSGNTIQFGGNFVPADHWSVLGASMQKYLVGKIDRAELAKEIEDYWTSLQ